MFEIIAAIAAAVASAGSAIAAGAVSIGLTGWAAVQGALLVGGLALSRLDARKARDAANDALRDRNVTVRSSDEAAAVIYGRMRTGGVLVYGKTHGYSGEYLSLVIALAAHEVDAIEDVWFDDASVGAIDGNGWVTGPRFSKSLESGGSHQVTGALTSFTIPDIPTSGITIDYVAWPNEFNQTGRAGIRGTDWTQTGTSNTITILAADAVGMPVVIGYRFATTISYVRIKRFLGIAAGERDTDLEGISDGEWTETHLGKGIARLHVTLCYDDTLFPNGLPTITAIVRGKKVYDPRTTLTTWSRNAALIVRDYLVSSDGFGCDTSEIDSASVIEAADICEQDVPIDVGTQDRYLCDCALSSDATRKDNLEALLSAMVGTAYYSGGVWSIRAGAYRAPSLTLDDGDLADGPIDVQSRTPRRDLFNSVRGRFRSAAALYAMTSWFPYRSQTYIDEDSGEEIWREIDLPCTTDAFMARRIGKLILLRSRQAVRISATWKLGAIALQPSDTVYLKIKRYGWDTLNAGAGKIFRVVEYNYDPIGKVGLTLIEEAAAVYDWAFNEALGDPAPNTELPNPGYVPPLENVVLGYSPDDYVILPDGTVRPFVTIAWDLPTLPDVRVEVFWKRIMASDWTRIECPIGAVGARIEPVSGGETLSIYLQAFNAIGVRGASYRIPTFIVHPGLPTAGYVQPVTGNLLHNATWEYGIDGWESYDVGTIPSSATHSFVSVPAGYGRVNGVPSNAALFCNDPMSSTGSGYYVGAISQPVPVVPGALLAVYADLLGWNSDSYVALAYYTAAGGYLATAQADVIAGVPWATVAAADYSQYATSGMFSRVPAGAAYAKLVIAMQGNWLAGATKVVFAAKPFVGVVVTDSAGLPTWDAGGSPVIDTPGMVPEAATKVYQLTDTVGAGVANPPWIVGGKSGQVAEILLSGPQISAPVDGKLEVTVSFTLGASYGSDSTARRVVAFLGRSVNDSPLIGTSQPVTTATSATETTATYTVPATFDYVAGEVIQPFLAINRETIATAARVTKALSTPGASNNLTDRCYGAEWRATLVKR